MAQDAALGSGMPMKSRFVLSENELLEHEVGSDHQNLEPGQRDAILKRAGLAAIQIGQGCWTGAGWMRRSLY